ncbi:hypothetical protein KC329_g55 [Hortaea werneckii]|nr:hypothetical protein KC329_g55 [Hortaea werneckii]
MISSNIQDQKLNDSERLLCYRARVQDNVNELCVVAVKFPCRSARLFLQATLTLSLLISACRSLSTLSSNRKPSGKCEKCCAGQIRSANVPCVLLPFRTSCDTPTEKDEDSCWSGTPRQTLVSSASSYYMKLAVRPAHPQQNERQIKELLLHMLLNRVWYGLQVDHISSTTEDSCLLSDPCVKVELARYVACTKRLPTVAHHLCPTVTHAAAEGRGIGRNVSWLRAREKPEVQERELREQTDYVAIVSFAFAHSVSLSNKKFSTRSPTYTLHLTAERVRQSSRSTSTKRTRLESICFK